MGVWREDENILNGVVFSRLVIIPSHKHQTKVQCWYKYFILCVGQRREI